MRFLLSGIILTAPFYYYRFAIGPFNVTFLRLFLLASLFLSTIHVLHRGHLCYQRTNQSFRMTQYLAILFLLYSAIQVFRSHHQIGLNMLLIQFEGYFIVMTIAIYTTTVDRLYFLVRIYLLSVIIPGIISFYQICGVLSQGIILPLPFTNILGPYLVEYDEFFHGGIHLTKISETIFPRSASTLVDANFYGVYLSSLSLICISLFLGKTEKKYDQDYRGIGISYLVLLTIPLLLTTMSRSSWMGFTIGIVYIIFMNLASTAQRKKALHLAELVGLILLVVIGISTTAKWEIRHILTDRILDFAGGLESRMDFFSAGLEAFYNHVVFGLGKSNLISYTGYPTAHSFFLTRLFEDGLVGFILVCFTLFSLWFATRPKAALFYNNQTKALSIGLRAAFLSLIIANILYDHLMSIEVNWILLGLLFACAKITSYGHVYNHDLQAVTAPIVRAE